MSRVLCDSLLSQFRSTWRMMEQALEEIDDERWLWGVNGWTYADTIYHLIITQEFYIRDKPEGMRWGSLYGDKELMESSPSEYYPTREVLLDYKEITERKVEDYLCSMNDSDLLGTDGFSEYLPTIHEKLLYLVRHNAHHIGELTLVHRELDLGRIKWVQSEPAQKILLCTFRGLISSFLCYSRYFPQQGVNNGSISRPGILEKM